MSFLDATVVIKGNLNPITWLIKKPTFMYNLYKKCYS